MRGLRLRIAVNVAAAVLVGLLLADIGFLYWSARQHARERRIELRLAAATAARELAGPRVGLGARLEPVAAEHDAALTVMSDDVVVLSTLEPPPDLSGLGPRQHAVVDGFEHVAVDVTELQLAPGRVAPADAAAEAGTEVTRIVASRRLNSMVARVLEDQRAALLVLATIAVVMILLALALLTRAVVGPIRRLTGLVGAADRAALSRVGEATGDLGELGRAIISMTQRIEEDRQRIAWQLAELSAAHEELRRTEQQLVRAERLSVVGKLAAGLAHEIGNPLAILSGYAEVLGDPELPSEVRKDSVARMARELDRIHATVRALLDYSRAPAKAAGRGEVGEVVEHVRKLLAPQQRLRGVELEVAPQAAPVRVPLDSGGLTQVLLNLALNAADAVGGAGSIRLAVEPPELGRVRILVEDSGPGIPEELAARIFEPFFTTKAAGSGSGLGLAVCDSIVTAAGGELTVSRSPGLGGARFCVTLPVGGDGEDAG